MKTFRFHIEGGKQSAELDLQEFLYGIAIDCHNNPNKISELNHFVPAWDNDALEWTVYFGTEEEVNNIDKEHSYAIEWLIDYKNSNYKGIEENEDWIYEEIADYITDYWIYDDEFHKLIDNKNIGSMTFREDTIYMG